MDYIKEDKVIEDVKKMLAIPKVNGVLFHAIEEMKYLYHHEIKQYKELESTIDQKEDQTIETKPRVKQIEFELEKKRKTWTIIPENEIPEYVIDHIINLDIDMGQSHMERFKIEKNKTFDLVVTKHYNNYFTGSIKETITPVIEKQPVTHQHQQEDKMPAMGWDKKEEIKTILNYLLKYEIFYDFIRRLFRDKWKHYLDKEIFKNNANEKKGIISG
jgi:hypothetical protein